jgi:serine protease
MKLKRGKTLTKKMKWTLCNAVRVLAVFLGVSLTFPPLLLAGGNAIPQPHAYTSQLIVKYRDSGTVQAAASGDVRAKATALARLNNLTAVAGIKISHVRFMSGNGHVVKLPRLMTTTEANAVARKLNSDPNVEYAEPDIRMFPKLVPNDPYYANQWHYMSPATAAGGANLPGAWDITTGSSNIVVAVIDWHPAQPSRHHRQDGSGIQFHQRCRNGRQR